MQCMGYGGMPGMGGGMPIGAFIASWELMNLLTFNPELGHITTFGGHPINCAASIATLNHIISSDLLCQVDEKEALSKYGSSASGASLGDILGSVLKK